MFDVYVSSRRVRSKAKVLTAVISALVNGGIVAYLVLQSFWAVEKLHSKISLTDVQWAPKPPGPVAAQNSAPAPVSRPKSPTTRAIHQPTVQPQVADSPPALSDPTPSDGPPGDGPSGPGVPGAISTGPGEIGLPGTDVEPPPPIPAPPQNVPSSAIEAQRIAGNIRPPLPVEVKVQLAAQGVRQVSAAVFLCLDAGGVPQSVDIRKSTGYPAADENLVREVQGWRYRPYRVNGAAVPVCTAVVFVYQID